MDQFEAMKAELDKQLQSAAPNVGVAFGVELFDEFRRRGWFTLEDFGVLGTSIFSGKLPAYRRTHFAFQSWDLSELEFRVGKSE
jgi:hypothetical protein